MKNTGYNVEFYQGDRLLDTKRFADETPVHENTELSDRGGFLGMTFIERGTGKFDLTDNGVRARRWITSWRESFLYPLAGRMVECSTITDIKLIPFEYDQPTISAPPGWFKSADQGM